MTVQGWTKNQRAITGDDGGVDYFFSLTMVGKAGWRPDGSRFCDYIPRVEPTPAHRRC